MIGIVILNYNSYIDTINLVYKLQNQTVCNDLYIVIVDNNSPNNSYLELKPLEKQLSNIVVLQTGDNLGYAKGNNFGLDFLEKNISPEYVVILNNDVSLENNCLEKLIERYKLLNTPGIIAPKQINDSNSANIPFYLTSFCYDCLSLFYITKLFLKREKTIVHDNTGLNAMRVDIISGSFMFSSFEKFKLMGYFYPNTFLFAEERFIAFSAKKNKLINYVLTDLSYIHAHSKTINTVYSHYAKIKFTYDSWIEYTKVCRKNGNVKSILLKLLTKLSLLDLILFHKTAQFVKSLILKKNKF